MYDYTKLTFTELVAKIGKSRFFHLPKMLEEILGRLVPQAPKYKVYTALLSQSGTDAPIATVLENTIGDIVWNYETVGTYKATLVGSFLNSKTYVNIGNFDTVMSSYGYFAFSSENEPDGYLLQTFDLEWVNSDNVLANTTIEIRVYN